MPYLFFKSLPLHPPTFLTPLTFNVILNSTSLLTKTSAFKSKAKNTTNKETEKIETRKKQQQKIKTIYYCLCKMLLCLSAPMRKSLN